MDLCILILLQYQVAVMNETSNNLTIYFITLVAEAPRGINIHILVSLQNDT